MIGYSKVTTLAHKVGNDAVEGGALKVQRHATLAHASLTCQWPKACVSFRNTYSGSGVGTVPVQSWRKFSAVFGTTSSASSNTMRPAGLSSVCMTTKHCDPPLVSDGKRETAMCNLCSCCNHCNHSTHGTAHSPIEMSMNTLGLAPTACVVDNQRTPLTRDA